MADKRTVTDVITDALITFVCTAARAVLGLIPTWTVPATPFGTTSYALGSMAALGNGYFPVVTLAVCLALVLGLKVVLLGWRFIVFVYHQFWGAD